MATKQEHRSLDRAHFNHLKKHIPGYQKNYDICLNWLLGIGAIQVSTAAEYAIANQIGSRVIGHNRADLNCGSEVKLATARISSYGRSYSAPVTNISGKTGDLLVQVYERHRDSFYLFRIPHSSYSHIKSSSNIEIPFYLDGEPRKSNTWWQYEVQKWA